MSAGTHSVRPEQVSSHRHFLEHFQGPCEVGLSVIPFTEEKSKAHRQGAHSRPTGARLNEPGISDWTPPERERGGSSSHRPLVPSRACLTWRQFHFLSPVRWICAWLTEMNPILCCWHGGAGSLGWAS